MLMQFIYILNIHVKYKIMRQGNIVRIFFYKFLIRVKNRKRIKILRLQNEKIF